MKQRPRRPSFLCVHTSPYQFLGDFAAHTSCSILQLLEAGLDDGEGGPGRLDGPDELEACVGALEEGPPRAQLSFAGANQREHVQVANAAEQSR